MTVFTAPKRFKTGFSLTETIVAMVVIAIAVTGTISLRYQSALDARRAEVGMTASRAGLMMLETWRGLGGTDSFDPVASLGSEISIETSLGPPEPNSFTPLGSYHLELNNVDYYSTLSYKDLNADLRALNVRVQWEQRGTPDAPENMADKIFALTVYSDR